MSLYNHFRPEEKEFVDKVIGFKYDVENSYAPKLLDFLDPREQEITKAIIGSQNLKVSFLGGADNNERKRAIIYPEYFEPTEEDYSISLLEIEYPSKFVTIEHPQVLGSLMSLGVKREKFGDIICMDSRIQLIIASEMESYIRLNFDKVGKTKIRLKNLSFSELIAIDEDWQESTHTCASLRLDAVISTIFNISRAKAQEVIDAKRAKVNFKLIESSSFECQEGDMLSIRGFGRAKIIALNGLTKKEKIKMVVGKLN